MKNYLFSSLLFSFLFFSSLLFSSLLFSSLLLLTCTEESLNSKPELSKNGLPTANELESIFQSRGWKANITSDYSILKARTESTGFCEPEPPGGQIVRLEVPIVLPEHGLNAMGQSSTVMMLLAASSEIFKL